MEALKRTLAEGTYKPGQPPADSRTKDFRYKAPKLIYKPNTRAAIIYMMDVSGSMGEFEKRIVRTTAFWIDIYLRGQYKDGITSRYIVHDSEAKEVDSDTFYTIKEAGGTKMSSPIELADKIMTTDFPLEEWNTYLFQFSDGDNWGEEDTNKCAELLKKMYQNFNQYAYCEVSDRGTFKNKLEPKFENDKKIVLAKVTEMSGCFDALKLFLGKGN